MLPFAARVCADIARHPQAMLRPAKSRSTCSGFLDWTGRSRCSGERGRGTGGLRRSTRLRMAGRRAADRLLGRFARNRERPQVRRVADPLRDDPAVLGPNRHEPAGVPARPWTPRVTRMIRIAKAVPAVPVAGGPPPEKIGVQPCTSPVANGAVAGSAGSAGSRSSGRGRGRCSRSRGLVGHPPRPTWRVLVRGGDAELTIESGPALPQTGS